MTFVVVPVERVVGLLGVLTIVPLCYQRTSHYQACVALAEEKASLPRIPVESES